MRTGTTVAALVLVTAGAAATWGGASGAESAAAAGDASVRVEAAGPGASASAIAGGDSVSIVAGAVTIDGEKVPPDATRFTARSGKTYVIDRANGRTAVHAP